MASNIETRQTNPSELVDEICDRYEQGWLDGTPAELKEVVLAAPEPIRPQLFYELLAVYRDCLKKNGQCLNQQLAIDRFGELGPWATPAILQLFAVTSLYDNQNRSAEDQGFEVGGFSNPALGRELSQALGPRPADLPLFIGKYRVLDILGKGGMGIVYLAQNPGLKGTVAVKLMNPSLAALPETRRRFLREAQAAHKVRDDNVVVIHDIVDDPPAPPFIVMEHLRGESLEDRLRREPLPSLQLTTKVILEIAAGLVAAEKAGLVHRDVKPANIWLEGDRNSPEESQQVRRVKVLDFGLARAVALSDDLTSPGMIVGTGSYMAPEQADGRELDNRADLFSLGCILYRMLAGEPPFKAASFAAVLELVRCHQPLPPHELRPEADHELSELAMKLLEKNPENRPKSAAEVAAAIRDMGASAPGPEVSNAPVQGGGPRRFYSRRQLAMLAMGLLVFGGALGAGRGLYGWLVPASPSVAPEKASFAIKVRRPGFDAKPIAEVVPLRNGDTLQVRFQLPAAIHASLVYVDTTGKLEVLETYPPEKSPHEAVWPAVGEGRKIEPPAGTEFLFVCGRRDRPVTAEELQTAWDAVTPWPALEPGEQLLRIQPNKITQEGVAPRGLGKTSVPFPEQDPVRSRLDQFRGKLRAYDLLEGLAFRQQ